MSNNQPTPTVTADEMRGLLRQLAACAVSAEVKRAKEGQGK